MKNLDQRTPEQAAMMFAANALYRRLPTGSTLYRYNAETLNLFTSLQRARRFARKLNRAIEDIHDLTVRIDFRVKAGSCTHPTSKYPLTYYFVARCGE